MKTGRDCGILSRRSPGNTPLRAWILLFSLLASCRKNLEPTPAPLREQVSIATVVRKAVPSLFETFGTVVHVHKADVHPTAEGILDRVEAEEGERVRRGEVLGRLETKQLDLRRQQLEAEVASKRALLKLAEEKVMEGRKTVEAKLISIANAEAELEQKQTEYDHLAGVYENKQKLFKVEGITKEDLESVRTQFLGAKQRLAQAQGDLEIQRIGFRDQDLLAAGIEPAQESSARRRQLVALNTRLLEAERFVAEAELGRARSELASVELLLEETTIRAPISGVVANRYRERGEKCTPETPLFTLFATDPLFVQAEVGEKDLGRLRIGQKADIRVDGLNHVVSGEVALIAPFLSTETRTARLRILIPNREGELTVGMFVRISIRCGQPENLLIIPQDALLGGGTPENSSLFLVRNGRVYRRTVSPGRSWSDAEGVRWRAIAEGLAEGDMVCRDPSASWQDGQEVVIRP